MTDRIDYTAASSPAVKAMLVPLPDAPPDSIPEDVPALPKTTLCQICECRVLASETIDGIGPECRA